MTKIDAINDRILRVLKGAGRISNQELAERVGLSPSSALRRVQDLERSGVILGYRARLNPVALERGFLAYVTVGLSVNTRASLAAFEKSLDLAPQVTECHNVTGEAAYLLRVEVADLAAYKAFHTDLLAALPQVTSITTLVVLASPKDERA